MSLVETGSVDAIYSAHNIEHVYPHEVPIVLNEFYRVLNDSGIAVLRCPDLQSVCEAVVNDKLLEPLYKTVNGILICPIDILYGWRLSIAKEMNTWHIRAVLHILFLIQPFRMLAFSQDMAEAFQNTMSYS